MSDPRLRRIVVVGTGTGVGKTRVTLALARALRRQAPTAALKPVESGEGGDAAAFDADNSVRVTPHPCVALRAPLSPHLAARLESQVFHVRALVDWVENCERELAISDNTSPYIYSVIETAGGALSPLSPEARNLELAVALEPAVVVLVAPDGLGVLHGLSATLIALRALGRPPDVVALSAAWTDASTGTNASELRLLGIADPAFVLGPGEADAEPLAQAVIAAFRR
ncbi:MAG: dethiobiotin synthase [Polyangiaceae bacterium]|nr:dethiobiotin synthase [Polyangiaceae bacterium]